MNAPDPGRGFLFAAEGEVVEIFDETQGIRARVVLKSGTLIDVTAARGTDVHLGDRVVIEGTADGMRLRSNDVTRFPS